ncbi:MAG TPA: extracellular solute-binding protein [Candidatus Binatia bacterium]|jgi:iron(III) transport system substrate-binding protein
MNLGKWLLAGCLTTLLPAFAGAGEAQTEWEKTLAAARKEGTLVVGIPASAELRKAIEAKFPEKFKIPLELFPSRGPENATRIINEHNAGVRYFDAFISGGATPLTMIPVGAADELLPYMILPEVKEPKNWWGGHIWEDNVSTKKYIYAFQCYTSETFWYNTGQVQPNEIRSYDDLLNPKWKGRIGFLDPRNPGSGQNSWTFLWKVKGEEYLKKLVQLDLLVTQNQRQLAEGLAKGKLVFTVGLSHYTYEPFMKSGLPVGPIPRIKEGGQANNGSGVLTVVKNPPHPNAAKIFVTWLLGKEGQELYGKAMIQGSRRLDVDTQWLREFGIEGCKDVMTVDDYYRLETHLESSVQKLRTPAIALATKLLK